MDDIDLDNIEDLSLDKLGAAIGRTLSRLERLQALYLAVAADDRRRVERLVQEYHRAPRAEREKG
jgi:hypothetical protein